MCVTHAPVGPESDEALLNSFTPQQVRKYFPPPNAPAPVATSEIPRYERMCQIVHVFECMRYRFTHDDLDISVDDL